MDLVLCHTTADFDTLGAAVGLTRLLPGARIVLSGGCHPTVQYFLALHRDEYPLLERRAVHPERVRSLTLVDAQQRDRFGPAAAWITLAIQQQIPITIYDHHGEANSDIPAQERVVSAVGAATTLIVERLRQAQQTLTVAEATVMALGIHVDTGSLTYEQSTGRDALALAWLMDQGANLQTIAEFVEPGLSPQLQDLLTEAMDALQVESYQGYDLAWVLLAVDDYVPGLSSLTERLISLSDSDVLLLGAYYAGKQGTQKLTIIGRTRGRLASHAPHQGVHLGQLFQPLGGGGHATAAALAMGTPDPMGVLKNLMNQVQSHLPQSPIARDLMSSPVRTIRPQTTIREAQRILLRYGHSGLSVVNQQDELVGMISRRDLDLAIHHGFSHAPVKGYMTTQVKTITPQTPLSEIEALMVTYDIGRLPVLDQNNLVGVVTRTDVLRQLHQGQSLFPHEATANAALAIPQPPSSEALWTRLQTSFSESVWTILLTIARAAEQRGWHLYLVGGAVRDLLLSAPSDRLDLADIDLVVDGFAQTAQVGAGVALAQVIQDRYPDVDLQTHGRFQTAALVWHKDEADQLGGLMIDIATARTEFYPYPAANPEVEASSIQQDLYRRDFTINAMAIRLTSPTPGRLLDFFGGLVDLQQGIVRVLHANSFIEDPTRIYRAVRFAVRLGFTLDDQTRDYIHHAIDSGIYSQMQRQVKRVPALQVRLKNELRYILAAPYWQPALHLLDQLQALQCIHRDLVMTPTLWHQLRLISRWINRFGWQQNCPPWQMRLEILLAALPVTERSAIATALQLPDASIRRQQNLATLEAELIQVLQNDLSPSQIYRHLHPLDHATLLLISARHPRPVGQSIWRYLTHLAEAKPPLNGDDLKALGYRPGPQYRQMLDALLAATLDGYIKTRQEAETFLASHYPPPS